MMNVEKLQNMYFGFYTWGKKKLITRQRRKTMRKHLGNTNILTREEKRQAIDFWAPYAKIDPIFHAFYKEKTGVFDPYFLPTDLYINCVDMYFNDRNAANVMDNKCLYSKLFSGIPQPEMVLFRVNDFWFDGQNRRISAQEVKSILDKEQAVFVKAATNSWGGKGVYYISAEDGSVADQFTQQIRKKGDLVVQRPVVQHPVFATMNASSVNTFRILSLLTEDGVKFYSALVRIGINDRKVDNGGLSCGVQPDGKLNARAYRLNGESFTKHPNHDFTFEGYQLIGFEKAKALIEKAHPMVPFFRMISWDIAINEQGEPVMLEANFAKGCLDFLQLNNGPLFGEDTKKIMDEVFGKNK